MTPVKGFLGLTLLAVICAAVISFFLSLQAGLLVLFFAAVAYWAWLNPEISFLFLLVILPLLPLLKITQTVATLTLIKDVLIITLFVKLFLRPLGTKQLPYRRSYLIGPLLLLGFWTVISMARADVVSLGILRARDILLYPLLYFVALHLGRSEKLIRERYAWLLASGLVVLLLGVYQWFFAVDSAVLRFDPARQIWIPRLSSILAHPSIFGEYVVILSVLWLAIAASVKTWWVRIVHAALFFTALPFIFLTYSRGVWIGLVAAVGAMGLVWLIQILRQRVSAAARIRSVGVGIVLLVVAVFGALQVSSVNVLLRSTFDPTYKSNEERLEFVARLIAPVTPLQAIVGQGLGDVLAQNFREVELESIDIASGASREVQLTKNATLVDNQYLKTFIEMGLIGLVIYAVIYWRFFKSSWDLVVANRDITSMIVGLTGVGFLAAFMIQGLFIDIWDIFPTNALFWILAGLLSAQATLSQSYSPREAAALPRS